LIKNRFPDRSDALRERRNGWGGPGRGVALYGLSTKERRGPKMDLQAIAFYLLSTVMCVAALAVISARNPVHSVLFLITAFFSAAGLFVLLGAEFLAMLLVIVYVGAVAVLFLFVVMMLDVDFDALKEGFARYLPLGGLVASALVVEIAVVAISVAHRGAASRHPSPMSAAAGVTNAETIGRVLYTDYIYYFQAAGLVLLVAMIGAIVLTLKHKEGVRRQVVADQVARTRAQGLRVVDIKPGAGIAP
jgi:NADH-quinone oxidoreductase subunit J